MRRVLSTIVSMTPNPNDTIGQGGGTAGAVTALTLAMAGWGTIGIFAREADASPLTIAAWRCVFAIGALVVLCLIVHGFSRSSFTVRGVVFTLAGGVALVANWVLLFAAYETTTITITTVSYHAEPFFLVALGAMITRQRPSARVLVWLGVTFVGLVPATRFVRFNGAAADVETIVGALLGAAAGPSIGSYLPLSSARRIASRRGPG